MQHVDDFLSHLEHVQPNGTNEWTARCPGHEDRTSSLSVGVGDDGRVLVNCFAGCTAEQIAKAVGLEIKDLFPSRESNASRAPAPRVKPKPKASKARPLTGDELEAAKCKVSPIKPGGKAHAELEARGLLDGPLEAYQIGDDLVLEIRGPDGKVWNHKRRYCGENPKQRYGYVTTGTGSPAWCSPEYGTRDAVLIVEGELNAAAAHLALEGAGLSFDVQGIAGSEALPHAQGIKGREVTVYADDDDAGRKAIDKWAGFALEHGAVNVWVLEPLPFPADFCDRHATLGEWLTAALEKAKEFTPKPSPEPTADTVKGERWDRYGIDKGRICEIKRETNDDGVMREIAVSLCNFSARIIAETTRDDGAEAANLFTIQGCLSSGQPLPTIEVPAANFAGLTWVNAQWGARATVTPGQSTRDKLRYAIQTRSIEAGLESRTVYAHTGWRKLEGHGWTYLHAGGAIGKDGPVNGLEVQLKGPLEKYVLPEPVNGTDLQNAVRSSLNMLEVAPDRVSIPVFAAIWRAVLEVARFTLFLEGRTGSRKSGLAALALQFFGPTFDRHNLPGNWTSTENQLERLCFESKDVLTVIDDFNPTGSSQDVKRWHSKAERVLRAQGNGAGRGRLVVRPGGVLEQRPETPPRGLVLATGEDIPNGHSLRARLLIVEVHPGDVNLEKLIAASTMARSGEYARALAGFVQWLAPKLEAVQANARERAASITVNFPSSHGRTTDAACELYAGLEVFLGFALEVGAITFEESNAIQARAFTALSGVVGGQVAIQQGSDPVRRFLELLEAVLSGGHAHLADSSTGKEPENPERYGWREKTSEWQPQGKLIGWRAKDGAVYLEPEGAFGAVQKLSSEQGDSLPLQGRTLWKRMGERGLIARDGDRNTIKRTVQGESRRVVHVFTHTFEGEEKSPVGYTSEINGENGEQGLNIVPDGKKLLPENAISPERKAGSETTGETGTHLPENQNGEMQKAGSTFNPSQTEGNTYSPNSPRKTNPIPPGLFENDEMLEAEL